MKKELKQLNLITRIILKYSISRILFFKIMKLIAIYLEWDLKRTLKKEWENNKINFKEEQELKILKNKQEAAHKILNKRSKFK